MGQILPKGSNNKFHILVGYTPETSNGNPYFKVYNHLVKYSAATKVIRIKFKSPEIVTGHRERNGKKEWTIDEFGNDYREELIDYLNSPSKLNSNITVWTELRFQWNIMKGFDTSDINEYISGKADTPERLQDDNYIPYNMIMPDYANDLKNDEKGELK